MSEGTKLGETSEELIFHSDESTDHKQPFNQMSATKIGDTSGLDEGLMNEVNNKTEKEDEIIQENKLEDKNDSFANEFEKEMEKPLADYNNGDLIKGIIRSIEKSGVLVDINYKSDGYISNSELSFNSNFNSKEQLSEGDEITVVIDKLETKEEELNKLKIKY